MFDVTTMGALIAGLLSFLSPCILPIVPFYLSYLAGVGMNQISAQPEITAATRLRAFLAAVCFSLGVITVFVALGASATMFGQVVRDYFAVPFGCGANVECQSDRCLCDWAGLCLWLDALRWPCAGRDSVYGRGAGNCRAGGVAFVHLRPWHDAAFYCRCAFHRPVHAVHGPVQTTFGHSRKINGRAFKCVRYSTDCSLFCF